jgi:hypothetical protein
VGRAEVGLGKSGLGPREDEQREGYEFAGGAAGHDEWTASTPDGLATEREPSWSEEAVVGWKSPAEERVVGCAEPSTVEESKSRERTESVEDPRGSTFACR